MSLHLILVIAWLCTFARDTVPVTDHTHEMPCGQGSHPLNTMQISHGEPEILATVAITIQMQLFTLLNELEIKWPQSN